jgi:subtilisin family serine protease
MDYYAFLGCAPNDVNEYFRPLRDAVNYAQQRGVVMIASSGNFNAGEVSLPAGYPPVIAVGATGPDGIRSPYSSFGKNLDLMAPGGRFTQRTEDVLFVWSIKPNRSEGSLAKPDSFGVYPFVGTSAAAPHVTGAAALLMSRGVKAQGAIEQALEATAVRPPGQLPGRNLEYGAGLIQIDAALRNAKGVGTKGPAAKTSIATRLLTRNPAGEAALAYRVEHAGRVRVRVFDVRGALVRALEERDATAGERTVRWDGRDGSGAPAATGVYLVRVETPDGIATRKVAILR